MQPQKEGHSVPEYRLLPLLERYRFDVDNYLRSFLTQYAGRAKTMIEYHLGFADAQGNPKAGKSEGKALRPTLCLLTLDALGGDWKSAVPAAAALELFHNFTLIHDDIQDNDRKRHGKPTVWSIWGKEQGINAGDAAYSLSTLLLLQLRDKGYSPEKVLQIVEMLFSTAIRLLDGQILDIRFEHQRTVSVDEYLEMIHGKTGVLIETSMMIGAELADTDPETKEHLRRYAQKIGSAFQIADDILGTWGDEKETGKTTGSDIQAKKQSLPIVLALNTPDTDQVAKLRKIYDKERDELDEESVQYVLAILDEMEIKAQAQQLLAQTHAEAMAEIQSAHLGWAEKDFVSIANALTFRRK